MAGTLADDRALQLMVRDEERQPRGGGSQGLDTGGAAAALSQLQQLSLSMAEGKPLPMPSLRLKEGETPRSEAPPVPGSLRVERTAAWLRESGGRVAGLLSRVLPPLCGHPRPSVREAAAVVALRLLRRCGGGGGALGTAGGRTLLDVVLTLAQDEWQQVSVQASVVYKTTRIYVNSHIGLLRHLDVTPEIRPPPPPFPMKVRGPCIAYMSEGAAARRPAPSPSGGAPPSTSGDVLQPLLEQLVSELLPAVRRGEAAAIAASRRLASAMLLAGPEEACRLLVQRPAVLTQLLGAAVQCFVFDQAGALLLLHSSK